jgi:hypothetical protein
MRQHARGLRATIFVGSDDVVHHKPVYSQIIGRAHQMGLAGASFFRGLEGYGSHSVVHTNRILSLAEDLPAAVVIVDREDKVREFLPLLNDLIDSGLIVLDEVEMITYTPGPQPADRRVG